MSVEGPESDEDQHEIMFYSLRHAATVTLKEMHHFGSQVLLPLRPVRANVLAPCVAAPPQRKTMVWRPYGACVGT
jgi:hypothetical protein